MSDHDPVAADEDFRGDEYAELWHRIVVGGWNPGDMFRTSKGVTWQFREIPYTSDFPEWHERPAAGHKQAVHL